MNYINITNCVILGSIFDPVNFYLGFQFIFCNFKLFSQLKLNYKPALFDFSQDSFEIID